MAPSLTSAAKAVIVPTPKADVVGTGGEIGSSSDNLIFGVPRWAVAVAVGGVVAGVAFYVFGSSSGSDKKKQGKKKNKKDASLNGTPSKVSSSKKVTLEDVQEDEDEQSSDPSVKAVSLKNKGNHYFKEGRYELAIKYYSQAIEICPKSKPDDLSTFYQNRAAAHEQLQNFSSVLNDCTEAIKLNPRYVKALERRARMGRKLIDSTTDAKMVIEILKTALDDMTAVCILEGFSKQGNLMLVDSLIKELGRAEAKVAHAERDCILASDNFIRQYLESFEADPVRKAASTFERVDGEDLRGYQKALNAIRTGNFGDVISACTEEIEGSHLSNGIENGHGDCSESLVGAYLLRATFLILSKKLKEAMDDLEKVIQNEKAPQSFRSNALIKRASLHIQQCTDPEKDQLLSLKDFEQALEIDPTNPDVYFHRGQVYLLTEQVDKAVQDFDKSVELNPGFATAYVQKLYTDYRQAVQNGESGRVQRVLRKFEKAIETYPSSIEAYALFAQALGDQQQFDKADSLYDRAMKVDNTNANILVHRGLIQLQWQGNVYKATEYIEEAIKLDPKCEFAYETLGTLEVQRGNFKKAIGLFEKAIPLATTELEMAHLFGLKDAAEAQITVTSRFGLEIGKAPM